MRIAVLSDHPRRFAPGETVYVRGTPYRIEEASRHKDTVVAMLEGIHSQTEAAELRDAHVEVPEGDVPPSEEGTYYYFQVLGLKAYTTQGELLGVITDILATGANDVYVISGDGQEVLVPVLDDVVLEMDIAGGRLTVDLPPGLR